MATASKRKAPKTIDDYIAAYSPDVQAILRKIRTTIRSAAPDAEETISYRIPAFRQNGILVYFAAFKNHIGLYPPIKADAALEKAIAKYAGEKGNLRFPLDQPIPYALIKRIVTLRVKQNEAKAAAKKAKRKKA
ncbi:MAG TPA: DUF1801 domain-containing protein [Thermoanaerobaculia bacterium]|nr:DUF1801 domain-containing protein [Thermoanaerobaculia bacterium]